MSDGHGRPEWTDIRERGNLQAMRLLFWFYRHGGRFLVYPVVCVVVFYFYLTRSATRRHSALYLQRATNKPVTRWQVWRHHMAFARALMDRLGAWMGRIERTNVSFPGHATMLELQKKKQGGVLLGAHFGNLEMCRAVVENDGSLKLNVILHTANTENFNELLRSASDKAEVRLIQVTEVTPATAMMLKEKLDQGEFLILLADRLPPGNSERFFSADFLGAQAQFPTGPFWLALMLDVPVFFMAGYTTPAGYEASLELLYDGGRVPRSHRDAVCQEILGAYLQHLEALCRKYPLQWFNFFDYWNDDQNTNKRDAGVTGHNDR
ncbi:hypothetical protein QWI17_18255 [Gilvimarinus sp. SDUM040013]|uniref:Acyltransferase n=1 Tax=Gilvimarinus gilvus TaxID=3058038 RepID=A0ABU4S1K1_9GAMM|nr:hypothetical protein [Gilvimarinus sp. SDUM040013]MDO3387792.1 hypothetical protein [Gilvimarinus sp. SDUM040013]MDX6851065.1 hypothetical protein [Gilvimarinus sp. SDUM040013]